MARATRRSWPISSESIAGVMDWAPSEGVLGVGVAFDDQAVGPGGDGGPAHGRHEVRVAGAVRGVDHHRQVRHFVQGRHGRQRQRVADVFLEGADAALAEDDLLVAGVDDVLGRQQQLLQRARSCRV